MTNHFRDPLFNCTTTRCNLIHMFYQCNPHKVKQLHSYYITHIPSIYNIATTISNYNTYTYLYICVYKIIIDLIKTLYIHIFLLCLQM